MPSAYQKASLNALLGLFLEAQGHALPEHTQVKSASSLSRFLNRYTWSTRHVIQTTRQAVLQQIAGHAPHRRIPVRILIDLTTLEKSGKFWHLSTPTDDPNAPDPWVRMLNGKRGLRRNPVTIRHILFEMSVTRRNSLCSVRMCRIVME
jgi:hypothetical protein